MSLVKVRNNRTCSIALAGLIVLISGCSDTRIADDNATEPVATSENQAIGSTPELSEVPVPSSTPAPDEMQEPGNSSEPSGTSEPNDASAPSDTPESSDIPATSDTPEPTETPAPVDAPVQSDTAAQSDTPVQNDTPEQSETPAPSESPAQDDTPTPIDTPEQSEAPASNETPAPSATPEPSDTPASSDTPEQSDTPASNDTPEQSDTPASNDTTEPSDTATPSDTQEQSDTPATSDTTEPSDTPAPTDTPEASDTPAPTDTPEPSDTPAPTDTPEPSDTPTPNDTPEQSETTTENEVEEPPAATDNERSPGQGIAPDTGALLGANVAKETNDTRYEGVLAFEELIGRNIAIINRFHEFSAGVDSNFFWDRRHIEDGRTVMISWRATDNPGSINGTPDANRASRIVAGEFDREIEAMATALSDLEAPVLLRFNWEMDQDVGDPQHIGSTSEFIAAWRYVHDTFRELGVTNVEWVWSPRARSFSRDIGQSFYPGYDYVDWIGGSAVPVNSFTDPQTIYSAWNEWASSLGKPQLLWVGLRENPDDSRWKANFIDELRQLTSSTWQGVKAIVYYNSDSPLGFDYTIDTSNRSLQSFRALACDPHYTTTGDDC